MGVEMKERRWGILWCSLVALAILDPDWERAFESTNGEHGFDLLHGLLKLPVRVKILASALGAYISSNPLRISEHDDDIALRIEDPKFLVAERGKFLPTIRATYTTVDGMTVLKDWGLRPQEDGIQLEGGSDRIVKNGGNQAP